MYPDLSDNKPQRHNTVILYKINKRKMYRQQNILVSDMPIQPVFLRRQLPWLKQTVHSTSFLE